MKNQQIEEYKRLLYLRLLQLSIGNEERLNKLKNLTISKSFSKFGTEIKKKGKNKMPHDYKEIVAESEFLQLHRKHERRPQHLKEMMDYGESLRREMGDEAKMKKRAKEVAEIIKQFVAKSKESQNDTSR